MENELALDDGIISCNGQKSNAFVFEFLPQI